MGHGEWHPTVDEKAALAEKKGVTRDAKLHSAGQFASLAAADYIDGSEAASIKGASKDIAKLSSFDDKLDKAKEKATNIVIAQIAAGNLDLTFAQRDAKIGEITGAILEADFTGDGHVPTRGTTDTTKNKSKLAEFGELEQTEQAYLLQNLDKLKPEEQAPEPWHMPRLIIANTRENLLNRLTSSKNILSLMTISPKELSSLTPYIRIAKRDKITGQERVREFKFSSHSPNLAQYFSEGAAAASEVGLQSFDFETTGKNFFTATRSLRGSMVLFFKSFADLDTAGIASTTAMPWTELLFNHSFDAAAAELDPNASPSQIATALEENRRNRRAEIFVEIGYNYSNNAIPAADNLAKAVDDSKILLAIYPITTDFSFRDDGGVELTITFTASAEHSGDDPEANVLAVGSTKNTRDKIRGLSKKVTDLQSDISENPGTNNEKETLKTSITTAEAELDKELENQRLANYAKFIKYVYDAGRLYSFTVKEEQYRKGNLNLEDGQKSTGAKVRVTADKLNELISGGKESQLQGHGLEETERTHDKRTIAYFYLGDLLNYFASSLVPVELLAQGIDLVTDDIVEQSRQIVVGDYIFHTFPSQEPPTDDDAVKAFIGGIDTKTMNLSKLPVSVSMFNAFMYKNVMKHNTAVLTFDTFLKKAVPELIDNALDSHVKGRKWNKVMKKFREKKMSISMSTITGDGTDLEAKRSVGYANLDEDANAEMAIRPIPLSNIITIGNDPAEDSVVKSFTIIHGSRVPAIGGGATSAAGTNEEEDAARGIYHLSAGLDRGIVKNISFTQQSSRLKEINLLKSLSTGADADVGILRMPYDAEVKMFGNPSFHPGQYVVINPAIAGVGDIQNRRSIAAKLGLGGLYAIISVQTKLSSGLLESTLSCKWNNHISPPAPASAPGSGNEEDVIDEE